VWYNDRKKLKGGGYMGKFASMIVGVKLRLKPTEKQEVMFWKSAGTARWAYNYFLSESERIYVEEGRMVEEEEIRKKINNELKPHTHTTCPPAGGSLRAGTGARSVFM
jgi:putative transposase